MGLKVDITPEKFDTEAPQTQMRIMYSAIITTQKLIQDNSKQTKKRFDAGNERFEKIEKRVTCLKNRPAKNTWRSTGVAAGGGGTAGFLLPQIIDFFKKIFGN